QHAAGGPKNQDSALGRSKGGLTSKVHMLTDAHGNPKSFEVTEGNAHDMRMAESLSARSSADIVIADKGYDSKPLRDALLGSGKIPIQSAEPSEHL
ncbi:MAG TPA: transposase, partial [Oligoflexus sp.]|uniref:transposase n=1 Tax=Oligoflexus sp. TaxID=1971216 RepID=UPI002D471CFE